MSINPRQCPDCGVIPPDVAEVPTHDPRCAVGNLQRVVEDLHREIGSLRHQIADLGRSVKKGAHPRTRTGR